MQAERLRSSQSFMATTEIETIPSAWKRMWESLPCPQSIVPVWDGDYLYYALNVEKDKQQFWIIAEQMGVNLDDIHLRKKQGEQVFPIAWMNIEAPK